MNEVTKATNDLNFNDVYNEYKTTISAYLRTKVQNENKRDELLAEVFVKLFRHLNTYDVAKGKINTWLFTVVDNMIIDYYRSAEYNKYEMLTANTSALLNDEGEEAFQFIGEGTASTTMENNELSDKILTAFEQIKPTYKEIAIQFFIHEQKYNEIAIAMSIPLNTVKVAIMRAREVLQNNLKAEYASL
jgi:RNA polymerase sigma factor (sigma-70 family)